MKTCIKISIVGFLICAALQSISGAGFSEQLPPDRLTDSAKQAIEAAPRWLREDLADNFRRMETSFQDLYADMILNPSESRFRDEIAFCVANTGTANLQNANFIPDLLEENAFYLYEHDQYLDYVRLIDVSDPGSDDDYYTTTVYTIEEDGNLMEYELPYDIYYWFIVHPKIEDEWAHYIDPGVKGGVPAAPPVGVFWRDWLFTITEEKGETGDFYPILRDYLSGVEALWGTTTTGAIGALGSWIRETLSFDSGAERPIQPVRIYKLHMGRCGEHQDYATAAARACLIPCLNTMAIAEDHVWNEFWHQRWIHWEPVNGDGYIDNPFVYEDGWGKKFSGAFNVAGDGWSWDVIDKYSHGFCTVEATVLDANGDPVDGARLTLKKKGGFPGSFNFAGSDGFASALYGDEVYCQAQIQSKLGVFPLNESSKPSWYEITELTVDGETYRWTAQYPEATLPQSPWKPASNTASGNYRFRIDFNVAGEVRAGYYNHDQQNIYTRFFPGGSADMFIVDSPNFTLYQSHESFEAYDIHPFSSGESILFEVPYGDDWTVVVSAERKLTSSQIVDVQIHLEQKQDTEWIVLESAKQSLVLMPGDIYSASITVEGDPEPECDYLGTRLVMSQDELFRAGDAFWLKCHVCNNSDTAIHDIPTAALLGVYGEFWFWPSWEQTFDAELRDYEPGLTTFFILEPFTWPSVGGHVQGLEFYAAILTPQLSEIIGEFGYLTFGYTDN
ncbi:MAG: transglutaminase domain-containing protein [bacterium]